MIGPWVARSHRARRTALEYEQCHVPIISSSQKNMHPDVIINHHGRNILLFKNKKKVGLEARTWHLITSVLILKDAFKSRK